MSDATDRKQALPRKFFKTAAAVKEGDVWRIELDDRPLKTFEKASLTLPTEAFAALVASEWNAQGDRINPISMPLTRLANVAIDRTPDTRDVLAAEVAKYTETDLVCHLAEGPAALRERQDAAWGPLRVWAGQALDVVLVPVEGIIASPQPPASMQAARDHALGLDDYRLTGLAWACGLYGSAVLALAVERGELDAEAALEISRIDEIWQIEQWGEDAEAMAAVEARRADARAIGQLFAALPR